MAKKRIAMFLLSTVLTTTPLLKIEAMQVNSKPEQLTESDKNLDLRNYKVKQVEELIKVEFQKRKEIELEEQKKREEIEKQRILEEQSKQYWKFEVSFYDSCYNCTQNGNGQTASREYAQEGITIALPKDIPFGSEVHIEGTGDYIVQDRGGYIEYTYDSEGNLVMRVDVYVDSHSKALELGRYYAEGYVIIKN